MISIERYISRAEYSEIVHKAQAKPLLRTALNAQGTRVMSRNEEIMQKIENNENVWERTRDESPEALCLPELLSLLY